MMKVLFVCSGNSKDFGIPPFIKAQGNTISEKGVEVEFFQILGKGIRGYLLKAIDLRKYVKGNSIDLIHAHYTLSGWTAILAMSDTPIVLSLMGTDAYGEYTGKNKTHLKSRFLTILTYLIQPFVNTIISKSLNIEKYVYRKKTSYIIPNGVCLKRFKIYPAKIREDLSLRKGKKYILFLGDPSYKRKNFDLVKEAYSLIKNDDIELIAPYPVSHENVVKYLNASDLLINTSFMEGSSNVIKEAMACNCPIVTTNVGDARWIIGNTPGCFISSFEPVDVAEKLQLAIGFVEQNGRTSGRERIIELGLDSVSVAERIIKVYEEVLK